MPNFANKAAATLAAACALALVVPASQASANCANYAKLSLKQIQENQRKNCGNSGPEWNADMKALLAWCGSKSPQDVQSMLSKRKDALSNCSGS